MRESRREVVRQLLDTIVREVQHTERRHDLENARYLGEAVGAHVDLPQQRVAGVQLLLVKHLEHVIEQLVREPAAAKRACSMHARDRVVHRAMYAFEPARQAYDAIVIRLELCRKRAQTLLVCHRYLLALLAFVKALILALLALLAFVKALLCTVILVAVVPSFTTVVIHGCGTCQ